MLFQSIFKVYSIQTHTIHQLCYHNKLFVIFGDAFDLVMLSMNELMNFGGALLQ